MLQPFRIQIHSCLYAWSKRAPIVELHDPCTGWRPKASKPWNAVELLCIVDGLQDIQESTRYRFEPTHSRTAGGISTAAAKEVNVSPLNRYFAPKVLAGVLSDVYQPYRPLGTPIIGARGDQGIPDSSEAASLRPNIHHEDGYYRPQLGVPITADSTVGASGERIYHVDRTAPVGVSDSWLQSPRMFYQSQSHEN